VFENTLLKIIPEDKKGYNKEGWKELQNAEINNMYCLANCLE
jgi:hypothetical protein